MKAIALLSGGLDSTLAARIMQDQGIEIVALNMKTPFCQCDRKGTPGNGCAATFAAQQLGIPLTIINITDDFLPLLKHPRHGYGSHMNPCIDCRILKFKKAKEYMADIGASFIFTGEVLGQRPMSQHRRALEIIEAESGLAGLVIRPLSAKFLPETIPEKEGWVKREKFLSISGRSRKEQFGLARAYGMRDLPCPAGGCLLTDPEFSKRLKDLMAHEELTVRTISLLRLGRYFRLSKKAWLIVGRNEKVNMRLASSAQNGDYTFEPKELAGPTSLGLGEFNQELIDLACRITSFYCDREPGQETAEIIYKKITDGASETVNARPLESLEIEKLRI